MASAQRPSTVVRLIALAVAAVVGYAAASTSPYLIGAIAAWVMWEQFQKSDRDDEVQRRASTQANVSHSDG